MNALYRLFLWFIVGMSDKNRVRLQGFYQLAKNYILFNIHILQEILHLCVQ